MIYKLQKQYRLKGHDYSSNGTYFITICAKNKENLFGEIDENKIHLSPIGKVASDFWNEIPKHYSFVMLDEFTVMPNHIHGIIIICNPDNFQSFQCRNAPIIGAFLQNYNRNKIHNPSSFEITNPQSPPSVAKTTLASTFGNHDSTTE